MEITANLSKFNFISTTSHHQNINRPCGCFCSKSSTVGLPLHRPRRKIVQPIKTPTQKVISTATPTTSTPATTTSDILRLLDCLSLPIPNSVYISLVKECAHFGDPSEAIFLHAHINRSRRNRPGLALLNQILIMYVSCGCVQNARQVFDEMNMTDFNSWAIMIAGYADNDDYEEVLDLFVNSVRQCRINSCSGDKLEFRLSWILVCVLKACCKTMNLELGKQIHGWLLKSGYLEDSFLSSSLVNFYGKIGWLEGGDLVFDQVSRRNVVVWTTRIVNNCKEKRFEEALDVFNEMGKEGVKRNSFTFSSVLSACANMSDNGNCGEQVHANAIKLGLASKSYVQSGLVNMYGKFGLLRDAKQVFEMSGRKRNDACWNAMLTSYIQHGFHVEAIKFLYQMKAAGVKPHELSLNELRSLCGSKILE